nr:hypothetical protein [Tanacetum cinerariifolium]
MNEFYEMKGIRGEFSVARTPQQNGYSINSKAFRVFNTRTRFVEENLRITFLENKPNVTGIRPKWMFDIDTLTMSMNYQPGFAGNQTNGNAGTKANIDVGQARKKTVPSPQYVLLPLLTSDSQDPNSSKDKVADAGKKSIEVLRKENRVHDPTKEGETANTNITNRLNTVSSPVIAVSSSFTTVDQGRERAQRNEFESMFGQDKDANGNRMFTLVSAARSSYIKLCGSIPVNAATLPNAVLSTDHLMSNLEDTADLHDTGIFSGAYDYEVDGKHAIGTKWVYGNKKDDIGIVVRNKARLVAQGYTQEEVIDYDEVFALIARIEAIMLVFAYASFMGFIVHQMDMKSAFLYGTIEEEVYMYQPPSFEDPHFPNKVYKVEKALYGLHQAHIAWIDAQEVPLTFFLRLQVIQRDDRIFISQDKSMIGSLMYLTSSWHDIMFVVCACARFQVTPKVSHLHVVKRIFRYLKGQPKLGLWYPRDSPFDLEAFSDIVANSTTEAKYVAAANCCRQMKVNAAKHKLTTAGDVYTSCIEQFWATAKVKNVNGETHIQALVDKKKVIITEASIRRDLSSTMVSAIICLANNQKFDFSKYIFDNMVKHLDGGVKFLMYPGFVQVFLDNQVKGIDRHNAIFVISSHTKKVFANMKREGNGFSGVVTHLFETMMVQDPKDMGEEEAKNQGGNREKKLKFLHQVVRFIMRKVLDLEKAKTTQAVEISSLKKRVKKLERKKNSRTSGLKRLRKVGTASRVESSTEASLGDQEDASKQGRKIDDIDQELRLICLAAATELSPTSYPPVGVVKRVLFRSGMSASGIPSLQEVDSSNKGNGNDEVGSGIGNSGGDPIGGVLDSGARINVDGATDLIRTIDALMRGSIIGGGGGSEVNIGMA